MHDAQLARIRRELFYGIGSYTKNQPDFVVDRFEMVGPKKAVRVVDEWRQSMVDEEEILIYVHFPFCHVTCVFCNSFPFKADAVAQTAYVDALVNEIDLLAAAGLFAGKRVRCTYFGGGTPTAFADEELARVLVALRRVATFAEEVDSCIEAHPTTLLEGDRLATLRALGMSRISIGCQTFDAEVQRTCHRHHRPELIEAIVAAAKATGLGINIDMMIGLPGQTVAGVAADLEILDRIRPSAIEYIRHEVVNPAAKALYHQRPELLTADDDLFAMLLMSQQWLTERGYEQNGRYTDGTQWQYRYHWICELPIIGLGLRSRSYTKGLCVDKHDELHSYLGLLAMGIPPVARVNRLTVEDQMHRSLFLSLQNRAGLSVPDFGRRFGLDPRERFSSLLAPLVDLGCIETDDTAIRLTTCGAIFVEDVCDFVLDAALADAADGVQRSPHSSGTLD